MALAASVLPSDSASASEPHSAYVIIVSCDGMRPDAVTTLGTDGAPTFHRMIDEGATTSNARTDGDYTITLPNHSSMLSGRGVDGSRGHGWTTNSDPRLGQNLHRNRKRYVESMFDVAHDHGKRTALFASKTKFSLFDISYDEHTGREDETGEDNGKDKIDIYLCEADTDILVDAFLSALNEAPIHLSLLHLRDPDTTGHANGWTLEEGAPYLQAVSKVDALVGKVIDSVATHAEMAGRTTVIVTADHGGKIGTRNHIDGEERENFIIPFYVWGAGVNGRGDLYELNRTNRKDPGRRNPQNSNQRAAPVRNGEAGNLALQLLGLPAIERSRFNADQDLVLSPRR